MTGRVTDAKSNLPIAGATITSTRGTTTAGASGDYTIAGIAAGSQAISASAAGYAGATKTVIVPANGSATADFALSRATGAPIKAITFEGTSLDDPSNGVDSVSGTVARETSSPIKGAVSARVPNNAGGYMTENFAATNDLYVSFYFKLNAKPSSDARIAFLSNGGTTEGNLILRSTGALRMRIGSTTVGQDTPPLAIGQIYRVGLHQKKGSGANAVLEAFLAQGDAAFGAPFASTASGAWATQADRLRFGATNSQTIDATFDDVKLDAVAMPGPS